MKKNRNDGFPLRGNLSEILLRMKFTFVLCLCAIVQVFAAVNAQTVSLKKQNASLEEIIWELKEKTRFVFLYSDEDIASVQGINIDVKDLRIDDVLTRCLRGTRLTYSIVDETVVLKMKDRKSLSNLPQVKGHKVTGVVTDRNGNPLPGVTIVMKGTSLGVATDQEGMFMLEVPNDATILIFTMVGMESKEIKVGEQTQLQVKMEEQVIELSDVVVTGIFRRTKELATGASITISGDELKTIGNQNVLQSFRTLDPSFKIIENNINGSNPNVLPEIELRGTNGIANLDANYKGNPNQPLFILDGFETDITTVYDLDMNRVETIVLLKDAAAKAIYGAKAANGVVVIETRQPKAGKMRISYKGDLRLTVPDLTGYNLCDARE